jgi:Cys-rich repeat protein
MPTTQPWRTSLLVCALLVVPLVSGGPSGPRCAPIPIAPADCPAHVGSAAACSFRLLPAADGGCDATVCTPRCRQDGDCATGAALPDAPWCVLGNCVACWQDSQCRAGAVCRAGRCKDAVAAPPGCPAGGSCDPARCRVVSVSEEPCPVCVCDSPFNRACADDFACQVVSSYPYRACVWGRCAECRHDADCPNGTTCDPPGRCFVSEPSPSRLYGLWLVGWYGGLDHFSYLRFEPDGALRRGSYVEDGAWSDDILDLSCAQTWPPPPAPQLGTWEREETQSPQLAIRVRPNGDCWLDATRPPLRFAVTLWDEGRLADLVNIDGGGQLMAVRVPAERCAEDLSFCETPRWDEVYP